MKNIAIFCDGTWQNLTQRFPTNVTRLARAVAPKGVDAHTDKPIPQIVFYDDGVGVGQGVAENVTRFVGGAIGKGLDRKIAEAYEFLCLNFEPGDRIFIFGFSRGAYTARSLAGLLRKCWILRRENITEYAQAVEVYRNHSKDAVEVQLFRRNFCYPAATVTEDLNFADRTKGFVAKSSEQERDLGWVQYVGVWDTVGSLGLPRGLPFADILNDKYRFHDLELSRFVFNARHAVAIDEKRETFGPTLWSNLPTLNQRAGAADLAYDLRPYQQTWFPGGHGSVGGGEDDGGISIGPLLWIAEGAARAGLAFDPGILQMYKNADNPCANLSEERSIGEIVLSIAGLKDREGVTSIDDVSPGARRRWKERPEYRPKTLSPVAKALG